MSAPFCQTLHASADELINFASLKRYEIQANTYTASTQSSAAIAKHPDGGFAVVWHSRRQQVGTYGVYMQRFSKSGLPVGGERQVNVHTKSMQMNPAIAIDATGAIWVAWESFGQDGSFNAIIGRRFDPKTNTGSDEFLINQTTEGNQSNVVISALSEGATFYWGGLTKDAKRKQIFGRSFGANGKPVADEFMVSNSQQHQLLPSTAAYNGKTIVVWQELDRFGKPIGIFGRAFSEDGSPLTSAFPVVGNKNGASIEPSVAMFEDGRIVVAWHQEQKNEYEVFVRAFDSFGTPQGIATRVSAPGSKYVNGAALQTNSAGQLVVMWNHQTDQYGKCLNVFGQRLDRQLQRIGSVFPVNAEQDGRHRLQAARGTNRVVWNRDQLLTVWSGKNANDASSVNVTALTPPDIEFGFEKPQRSKSTKELEAIAKPHEPPTFDPALVAKNPFGGFESLGPAGQDFGFTAINATGWNPPDPVLAVGPNHLVAMTNGAIAFFDKSGTLLFSDQIEGGAGFWGSEGATGFVFDPEALFDPHSQRFFVMANERGSDGRSYFLIGVSDDDNPIGNWHRYRLDVTDLADDNIDSPNMGVDEDVLYLTADFFGPNRYLVYMLRKSDLLVGDPVVSTDLLINGSQSYGIPLMYDTNNPAFYMIQAFEFGDFNSVRLHAITDPLGNPQRVTTDVSVPAYGHPQDPPQQGTTVRPELFEARFWSCVYRDDSLWAVHHHSPNSSGTVRARWYEFSMNGWPNSGQTPSLVQSGEITPTNMAGQMSATFFPSIWVDEMGNAAITTARSSNTEFISMSRALRSANDPMSTFNDVELVQPSTSGSTGGRWGDYSATTSDPAEPGAFWGMHEFTNTPGGWSTYVAKYVIEPAIETYSPSSITPIVGSITNGTVADLVENDKGAVTTVAAIPPKADGSEIEISLTGNIIESNLNEFTIVMDARVNTTNVEQTIELFNYSKGEFETIDTRIANTDDTTVEINVMGDLFEYSTPAAGTWIARVKFKAIGPTLFFPWKTEIDQFVWQVSN